MAVTVSSSGTGEWTVTGATSVLTFTGAIQQLKGVLRIMQVL